MLSGKGGMDISVYGIVGGMSHEMVGVLCRAGATLVAMVLICRLVEVALMAGIDGVVGEERSSTGVEPVCSPNQASPVSSKFFKISVID